MTPSEIESRSFQIIEEESGEHGFSDSEWTVVRRMIHTSADFDYLRSVRFHPEAIRKGTDAIRNGKTIITDTQMARCGIQRSRLSEFNASVACLINDRKIIDKAEAAGSTRAHEAVDAAIDMMKDGIYVIGNAPTALLRLIHQVKNGSAFPALIIGMPVGFVNAAESKAELAKSIDIPYITNVGRKGGSNIAASIVNALISLTIDK